MVPFLFWFLMKKGRGREERGMKIKVEDEGGEKWEGTGA